MRATKILSNILAMEWVRVCGGELEGEGLVLDVVPTTRIPRCSGCGCRARHIYDRRRGRRWRHLDFGGMKLELRYDLRRVDCARCGVRTEMSLPRFRRQRCYAAFETNFNSNSI